MQGLKLDDASGRIEGLAIPFGGPLAGKDLDGERFTADTDLALEWFPDGRPILFDHGGDKTLGIQVVGRQLTSSMTEEGRWAEGVLNRAHRYYEHIVALAREGKLFFSSGAMPHLVRTDADGSIKRWPWVELSLTPTPANPYAVAGMADAFAHMKSLGFGAPMSGEGLDVDAVARRVVEELDERQKAQRERAETNRLKLLEIKTALLLMELENEDTG